MEAQRLSWYGLSDIGPIRSNNEDVWASFPESGLFAVADGMGGHRAGEVASREATSFLCNQALQTLEKEINPLKAKETLQKLLFQTNRHIYDLAQKTPHLQGMGTTLCCLLIREKRAYLAHVGDSRIYHIHNKQMHQLTSDHTPTPDKETQVKKRHLISRAIGIKENVLVDLHAKECLSGDRFLLCTDGLTDYVSDEQIKSFLLESDLKAAVTACIEQAKKNGSHDNITALVVEVQ